MTVDIARKDLTVGVVGTGAMGRGIAQVTASGGMRCLMFDAGIGNAARAREAIIEVLKSLVAKGRLGEADLAASSANLVPVDDLQALAPCDVVIEAVFENLEVKKELFARLESIVSPQAIIASNTSSIRIASIGRDLKHRQRIAGLHYFNPVPLMRLVEVIRAAETSPATIEALVALGKRQGRVPVTVGDTPGFLVNLGGTAIGTEGLRIVMEGRATPSQVDAVMRDSCGFRMGPFELMDLTGIDVNFPARKIIYEGFFHDRRLTPSPYHEGLFQAGRLGRKSGGGWYDYDSAGGKIDPGADHVSAAPPARSIVLGGFGSDNPALRELVLRGGAVTLDRDDGESPILVAPVGQDCTTQIATYQLDARRTVAVDLTGDIGKRLTIMTAPGADLQHRDRVVAMLARNGAAVTAIKDSPGFIAQRMLAMIANLGCEMAQIGIASPQDIDTAMTLGLNYPRGPLALADWLGCNQTLDILQEIQSITGDDRYRPSQWLRRRALLGLSATIAD